MSLSEVISKYNGHLLHITDAFHGMEEKYALLEPMLFNKKLFSKHRNRGFEVLRQSLFFSCVIDIVNIICQKRGKKTPSIQELASLFSNKDMLEYFHDDLINHDAFKGFKAIQEEQSKNFWINVGLTEEKINCLIQSSQIKAFETIRDKRIAHLELKKNNGNYELLDISTLGLKWGDMSPIILNIKEVIKNLNLITTGVNISNRDILNKSMSLEFWELENYNGLKNQDNYSA